MTDTPHLADHQLMADRDRLRTENARLEAENTELRAIPSERLPARGLDALQSGRWETRSDFRGCVE